MGSKGQTEASEKSDLDNKARLECEKLQSEIEVLRRPFYKSPAFYAATAPVALAIVGVIFTWASGWFDVQRTRIGNEKLLLQAQTERLQTDRSNLEAQAEAQQNHLITLENDLRGLRTDRTALTNQIAQLQCDRDELRSAKQYFESEARRLAGSDTNAVKFLNDLQQAQSERNALKAELNKLLATQASLSQEIGKRNALLRRANNMLDASVRNWPTNKVWDSGQDAYFRKMLMLSSDMAAVLPEWQSDSVCIPLGFQVEPDPTNTPGAYSR
jgi:hypothetical protein